MKKRIGSLLLSLALCLSLLPATALATEAQPTEPLPQEQAEPENPELPEGSEQPEEPEQPEQDEAVDAVQALMDALPDASALDEMDAEAQESACLAASEAYDAYDALTEEQQSALTGAENMIAILEWATQQVALQAEGAGEESGTAASTKPECGNDHEGWTAISTATELTGIDKAGNYYLTQDIQLPAETTWTPADGVKLCLNGYRITGADGKSVIAVNSGVSFTLTDCNGSGKGDGKITHKTSSISGRGVEVNGAFHMYDGSITGNAAANGGGVYVNGGAFHMYGGSITGNAANDSNGVGGGVYVKSGGTFEMSGGTIGGTGDDANTANLGGGGVFVGGGSKFEMSGSASITGNRAQAGGVYVDGKNSKFEMSGSASITGNKAASSGGGVYVTGGEFTMSGGTIGGTGNDANQAKNGGGVYVTNSGKFEMSGSAKIIGNKVTDNGGGVAVMYGGQFTMSGGSITGNTAKSGGGVYVGQKGTFEMNSGTIGGRKGNEATDGGGVYVYGGIRANDTGSFTMSGGSITGNTAASGSGGVYVGGKAIFTMTDGSITGNEAVTSNGGGVYVFGGTFNMFGNADITGNTANRHGGGVYVTNSGSFAMSDGTITGNKADASGGGVFVEENTTFTMSGGSITGNDATVLGGGVYVGDAITVSGAVKITDNVKNGTKSSGSNVYTGGSASNVYLPNGQTITIGDTGLTASDTGAKIGVTTSKTPTEETSITIATGATDTTLDYAKIFKPDERDKGYVITKDESGNIFLTAHQHNWSYTLSNTATITATCEGCPQAGGSAYSGGTLTLKAPTDLIYDGTAKSARVDAGEVSEGASGPFTGYTVAYQVKKSGDTWETLSTVPTDAGTYTASVTLGSATASVTYEITKATPEASDFTFAAPSNLTYDGNAKAAMVTAKTGMGDVTVNYFKNDVETEPKDAGEYTVKISVVEGKNYNAASDLTDSGWAFSIGRGTQTIVVPSDKTIVKNGKAVNISGWARVTEGDGSLSYTLDGTVPAGVTLENGKLAVSSSVDKDTIITIKVTAAATGNYNEKTETFTVKVVDKAQANVTIDMPSTLTYGDTFTLRATQVGDETGTNAAWSWEFDSGYFQRVESDANNGTLTLRVIQAGTPNTAITMTYTSDTHTGGTNVEIGNIAKKTLTEDDLNGIPDKLTKVYDGGTGYTYPNGTAIALTLKDSVQVPDSDRNMQIGISADQITFAQSNAGTTTATIDLAKSAETLARMNDNYKFADSFTSITVPAEITQRPLTVDGATAKNRVFEDENKNVDVSSVTFGGLPDNVTFTKGKDYTVTGKMNDHDAGMNKTVTVEVTMLNGNYSLAQNTTTTTVNINKASCDTRNVAISRRYNETGTKTVSLNMSLPYGVGSARYSIQDIKNENRVLSDKPTLANEYNSTVTYTLAGQTQYTANQTAQFSVMVESPNYEDFTILCVITLVDKGNATVNISGMPNTVTYGDTFTLTAETRDDDEGTSLTDGTWTWASTDSTVFAIEGNGSSATVKALKSGQATISVSYESDTAKGTASTANVTVKKATLIAKADDKSMYVNGPVPTDLTVSYTGFVNGDTKETVIATDATASIAADVDGKTIGSFDITPNEDTVLQSAMENNYEVVIEKGTLTVSSRPSSGGGSTTYTITAPAKTDNGSVTVSAKNAAKGDTVTITATPDKGYALENLTVLDQNGKEIKLTDKGDGKYTFTMPAGKVTVKASFMEDNTMLNYFVDVKPGDFFYDAVLWAAQKGITTGTDAVHFSPNKPCTRAQIVTFLWRAAGAPEPKSMGSFTDIPANSYYAKAVAWAIENGITTGTGDGKFSPDMVCSRAQAAAFLYRASGSPAVSGGSAFSDVAENAYYADAVAWAERSGVTEGVGGNRFGAGNDCTRAQIVTFLYRAYQGK